MKAIITAAGLHHRHLPVQTMADHQGQPVSILETQLRELHEAGVEGVGLVINPGDESLIHDAAGGYADFIECLPQAGGRGYGRAIMAAQSYVGEKPFLLSISDHLFVSDLPSANCFRQVMDAAENLKASVSAVQATHESEIHCFGTIGGERLEADAQLLRVREVVEKPTPTLAEQRLIVSGLRNSLYYAYFGIHVLQPSIFRHLETCLERAENKETVNLTDAVNQLLGEEDYYAIEVQGRRFDLEAPYGLLHGQLAKALKSPNRDQILTDLLELVAKR